MIIKRVLIIAEAGVNHNGDLNKAFELIDAASEAGADLVKFQTFKAEKLVSREAVKAEYQKKQTSGEGSTQFEMLKSLELSESDHYRLIEYCKLKGIQFLSTAFDEDGIEFLNRFDLPFFKSPSGEITNRNYLIQMAKTGKPIVLSTGMATMEEIKVAVDLLVEFGVSKEKVTVLHCNTEYPTPMEDVNLKAMMTIRNELDVAIGYSDHTLGIEVSIAAVALGARVIEKHFTLDRTLPGPDHQASLEPVELKKMVKAIRNVEKAISGDGIKKPSTSELKNLEVARKSLFCIRDLKKGEILKSEHLIALRPGNGISPMDIKKVIGRNLLADVKGYTQLKWDSID